MRLESDDPKDDPGWLSLRPSCDRPPLTSTDCSICDGAATSPAVATLLLADKHSHGARRPEYPRVHEGRVHQGGHERPEIRQIRVSQPCSQDLPWLRRRRRRRGHHFRLGCGLTQSSIDLRTPSAVRGMKLLVVRLCPVRAVGSADPGQGPCLGERRRVGRFDRWASSPGFSFGRPCDLPGLSRRARIGLCRCPAGSPATCQHRVVEVRGGIAQVGRSRDRPGCASRVLRGRDLRGRS